jgi:uncharacterized protein (DUF58 family)
MDLPEERQVTLFSVPIVLFVVAALLLVALLNSRSDLALLCILVLTVFGGAGLVSRASFWRLEWRAQVDRRRLFPDEQVLLTVEVTNAKFLPIWVKARIESLSDSAWTASGRLSGECGLLWHQQARFEWTATASRRGVYRLGPASITAADLFGLYPHEKPLHLPQVVVYPRLVDVKPLELPRQEMFGLPGIRGPVQDPVYLLGTRDYRSGRPARFIHWKASARHNRLQEKIFDSSEQEKVLLALDVGSFAQADAEDALERTLEVIASVAVQLDKRASAFGLACDARMTGGAARVLPVAAHRHQVSALLELLAHIEPVASMALRTVLSRGVRLPWGTSALVFSHAAGPALRDMADFFGSRRIPVTLVVYETPARDPAEALPANSSVLTLDQLGGANGTGA